MAFRWWRGGFPKFPYTNFHEANLDYFLSVFSEIWTEWEDMYTQLTEWKEQSDIDFQTWKDGVETALNDWKTNFEYRNTIWQHAMEDNISDWETDVIADLDSWKEEFIESYNDIETRVESIVSDTEDMIENLAEPFSSNNSYIAGDYVVYNGMLYKFTANHSGAWSDSDAQNVTAMDEFSDLHTQSLHQLKSAEVSALTSLLAMPKGVYFSARGDRIVELDSYFADKGLNPSTTHIVVSYRYASNPTAGVVEVFTASWGKHFIGYALANSTSITWYNLNYNERLDSIDSEITSIENMSVRLLSSTEINGLTSLTEMPKGTYFGGNKNKILQLEPSFPFPLRTNITYIIKSYRYFASSTKGGIIEIFNASWSEHYIGYITSSGTEITWYNLNYKNNKLYLFAFVSSFGYSTLGYVPALIKEIIPNIDFVLGMCYISGARMQDHLNYWNNNTVYSSTNNAIYSEYNSKTGVWENIDTLTAKQAISRFQWDYIILQNSVKELGDYSYTENLMNNVYNYLNYNFSFLYNMPQSYGYNGTTYISRYDNYSTGKDKSDAMYDDIVTMARYMKEKLYVSDVLPGGTAVQNARTTTLKTLGNSEDLCVDVQSHLQNGIAVLIPGYAVCYKLCQLMGYTPKIFGSQLNPTDSWLNEYNLYTKTTHGTCVGVSAQNKLIAQKCAMMAVEHPFEISDMSAY